MQWTATVTEDPEIFTKTGAYNFLKCLLGIPKKKACINKNLFEVFFKEKEYYPGFLLKIPPDKVKHLFEEYNIVNKNMQYYKTIENVPKERRSFPDDGLFKLLDEKVQNIASSLSN